MECLHISLSLSLAWPTNFFEGGACLDFFSRVGSITNRWDWIGCQSVAAAETNLEVEVLRQQLSPSAPDMPSAAFFRVLNRATSATTMGDCDGDGVSDATERAEGTDPYNARHFCFDLTLVETDIFSTTNRLSAEILFGGASVFGRVQTAGDTLEAHVGHLVATNGETATAYFWDDANTNGLRDAGEVCVAKPLPVAGHDVVITNVLPSAPFDVDGDGIRDWWEVALLACDLPSGVKFAKILPENYYTYIKDGFMLPTLSLNQEEYALVHDIRSIDSYVFGLRPSGKRYEFYESIVGGDSGNPRFFVVNNDVILLCTFHYEYGGNGSGSSVIHYKDDIQLLMDELSVSAGLNASSFRLEEFSFEGYEPCKN